MALSDFRFGRDLRTAVCYLTYLLLIILLLSVPWQSLVIPSKTVPTDVHIPHQSTSIYLNDITAPFLVNGSTLPNINFDIGESYSGLLPIDHINNELFFWFVPTTNNLAADEITIWLNGGPGCSSLEAFLTEQGPVSWPAGISSPIRNPWSWTNLTNMVWIEQPVGTGYSQGTVDATSTEDVAAQFLGFWTHFTELFGMGGRKVFLTGESYAGQYIPYIASAMLKQDNETPFNVKGALLYDPSIGWPQVSKQVPATAFTRAYAERYVLFNYI